MVDTTGAGDCFRGAFAVAFVEGHTHAQSKDKDKDASVDLKHCLEFASAASALCVQVRGAGPSMPWRAAADDELKRYRATLKKAQPV